MVKMNKLNLTVAERKQKRRYLFGLLAVLAVASIVEVAAYFIDSFYIGNIVAIVLFGSALIYLDRKLNKLKKVAMDRESTKGEVLP